MLLLAVAGFGGATIGFGASRSLALSLAMLVALGWPELRRLRELS